MWRRNLARFIRLVKHNLLPYKDLSFYADYFHTTQQIVLSQNPHQYGKIHLVLAICLYVLGLQCVLPFSHRFLSACNGEIFNSLIRVDIFEQQTAAALPLLTLLTMFQFRIFYLTVSERFLSINRQLLFGGVPQNRSPKGRPFIRHITRDYRQGETVSEHLQRRALAAVNSLNGSIVVIGKSRALS